MAFLFSFTLTTTPFVVVGVRKTRLGREAFSRRDYVTSIGIFQRAVFLCHYFLMNDDFENSGHGEDCFSIA